MRKSLRASVLMLALAFSAHAGEMPTPPAVPPPPQQQTAPGETQTPPAALINVLLSLLTVALP